MRFVFVIALAGLFISCDAVRGVDTAVRVTVTADGRPLAGARAALLARDTERDLYLVAITNGVSQDDGRVTLLVPDDEAVPTAASGYRLTVAPPSGTACSNLVIIRPVEAGTDTRVEADLGECRTV